MPSSAVERDLDRLHIRFLEAVHRLHDTGQISQEQLDRLVELMERIDEYGLDEFMQAWREATA